MVQVQGQHYQQKGWINLILRLIETPSLGTTAKQKKRFNSGIARMGGGVYPCPNFICALFLLKEKVSSMVATAERVGKVARIGGWVFFGGNSGNARI